MDACAPDLLSLPSLAAHAHFEDMGAGEWTIAIVAVLISVWAIWRSVGYALHPGETDPDHIKRSILNDDVAPQGAAGPPAAPSMPPGPPAPPLPAPR